VFVMFSTVSADPYLPILCRTIDCVESLLYTLIGKAAFFIHVLTPFNAKTCRNIYICGITGLNSDVCQTTVRSVPKLLNLPLHNVSSDF